MRLDDLQGDTAAWLAANERLWARARSLALKYPEIDVSDLYHSLVNLERTPEERLRRSLGMGRGLRVAHEAWKATREPHG